jgi:hypothetical protein
VANMGAALSFSWQQHGVDWKSKANESKFLPLQISAIPLLPNGLRRGSITEIIGPRSSGRTACLLHVLAASTARGEVCVVIDTHNQFHPASAEAAGVRLSRLVWIRCSGKLDHAMRAADLLIHAGGFGVIHLDLCETAPKLLNKIPLSYWFRFRRALESTPAILLLSCEFPQAKSCSGTVLHTKAKVSHWSGEGNARLLRELRLAASLRKPALRAPQSLTLAG